VETGEREEGALPRQAGERVRAKRARRRRHALRRKRASAKKVPFCGKRILRWKRAGAKKARPSLQRERAECGRSEHEEGAFLGWKGSLKEGVSFKPA
jgi:hypothetical protein